MEYEIQIVQNKVYTPSELLKSINNIVLRFNNMASALIQEYLRELLELEKNKKEKVNFYSYRIVDKSINKENFKLLIDKYIKSINPESQLCDNTKLFYVLHETHKLFPNLFKMYCDDNGLRDLLISYPFRDSTRDYSYHSKDVAAYENWIVEVCLEIEHKK